MLMKGLLEKPTPKARNHEEREFDGNWDQGGQKI